MPTRPLLLLLASLLTAAPAAAKVPTLDQLSPAGGRRGGTVEVTAVGQFDPWPVRAWVEPGRGLAVEPAEEKGKLRVTIAPDAPAGGAWLRLYNEEGASSLRPFVVGTIAEAAESEPNDSPVEATAVETLPVTLNGRLGKRGDVDGFAVRLDSGDRLVASVLANREIGSPMDAVLQVASPDGFVLAHNDDRRGFDPGLVFEAPTAGTYVVRVFAYPATPDSTIRPAGGDAYVYRITLTTGPFAEHSWPLAQRRGESGPVEVAGENLPPAGLSGVMTAEAVSLEMAELPKAVPIARVPHASVVECEGLVVDAPVSVSGRIREEGERDDFRLAARKDEVLNLRVHSRGLGFALDSVVRVRDAEGKVVAEADDTGRDDRDPSLTFKAPADGEYRVEVADLNGRGGPDHAYRLDVTRPRPDFRASANEDRLTIQPGKPAELTVTVQRIDGYAGAFRIAAEGLPPGVACETAVVPAGTGKESKEAKLTFVAAPGSAPASGPFRLIVRPTADFWPGRPVEFPTGVAGSAVDHGWLTVTPPGADGGEKDAG